MGERSIDAHGPRADDGGGASRSSPARSPRRSTCRRRPRSRRSRTIYFAGLEARPQGARDLPRQLQGRPAALATARRKAADARRGRRVDVVEYRPIRKRLPKKRPSADGLVHRRRRRGLHDRRLLPRRRPRRGLPQARQAGLDPGRRDGRLLDRDLDRAAVRRAARGLRLEVRQHALRAGRPDRRPRHPDGAVDDGLHLPSPRAGLPALRASGRRWASSPPRSAAPARRPGSYEASEPEDFETLSQSAPVAEGTVSAAAAEASVASTPLHIEAPAPRRACTPRPSCSRLHRQGRPTRRCA